MILLLGQLFRLIISWLRVCRWNTHEQAMNHGLMNLALESGLEIWHLDRQARLEVN